LFAVEAFSKQGVNGLPDGVLLDPWNEEAVLQAQQVVACTAAVTGSLSINCQPPMQLLFWRPTMGC
jgi:hypothetical protein